MPCPGCAQVPWNTPAGKSAVSARRRSHFLRTQGPLLAVVAFGAVMVAMGPMHLAQLLSSKGEAGGLRRTLEEGIGLRDRWERTIPGSLDTARLQKYTQLWLDEGLPQLLEAIEDPLHPLAERATTVMVLGKLFEGSASLGSVSPEAQESLIMVLRRIAMRGKDPMHVEAALVLRMLGISTKRVVDGASGGVYNQ